LHHSIKTICDRVKYKNKKQANGERKASHGDDLCIDPSAVGELLQE
jgi:hypothetical protein